MHDFNQLFCRRHSGIIARRFRINHLLSDVILDHLGINPSKRKWRGLHRRPSR